MGGRQQQRGPGYSKGKAAEIVFGCALRDLLSRIRALLFLSLQFLPVHAVWMKALLRGSGNFVVAMGLLRMEHDISLAKVKMHGNDTTLN